jgi:hypothetical protein
MTTRRWSYLVKPLIIKHIAHAFYGESSCMPQRKVAKLTLWELVTFKACYCILG